METLKHKWTRDSAVQTSSLVSLNDSVDEFTPQIYTAQHTRPSHMLHTRTAHTHRHTNTIIASR